MADHFEDNGVPVPLPALCSPSQATWEQALRDLVDEVARGMGGAAFLHDDPAAYRAGVRDVTSALLARLSEAAAGDPAVARRAA